jgi:hypothetical protein
MNYITLYNLLHPENPLNCVCLETKTDKFVVGSDSPSTRMSNQYWVSILCRTPLGGSTQFGSGYLGQPVNVNYLGRGEGQPGGSGAPPRNKF